MKDRIFGLETEYGCLAPEYEGFVSPDVVSVKVKDHIFHVDRIGIVDIHYRGRDEPPGNGGFLFNAGRVYIDMGHLEYATPECMGLWDILAADKAGDFILNRALQALGLGKEASFLKNNVDHYTSATFGCHENYLVRRNVPFSTVVIPALLPFLVTRQIFTGAGRVGSYDDSFYYCGRDDQDNADREDPVDFQISQRADHIVTEIYQWIQFSRAIINTRDEPLADHSKYRRLHLLMGDSNMSEYANALKIGTTALVLDLVERKIFPAEMGMGDPVWALKEISRDPHYKWILGRHNGKTISAVDVQRAYLDLAQRHLKGKDEESDWVLREWEQTLDDLETDPMLLVDRLDWVAKKWLLDAFRESEKLSWDDPWLQSLDLEYHNIDPNRGLYHDLVKQGQMRRVLTDEQILAATTTPPQDTRARARSEMVRTLSENRVRYIIDWDSIYLENEKHLSFRDPFSTYAEESRAFANEIKQASDNLLD
ncbi:MAG: proteasome accessory factor PafA2 family protein, partial [bacterium]|nr:proteasome accessory factor PafA2 family protein [bacterium]